jgi:V8-like Glu-specific endopeptidase
MRVAAPSLPFAPFGRPSCLFAVSLALTACPPPEPEERRSTVEHRDPIDEPGDGEGEGEAPATCADPTNKPVPDARPAVFFGTGGPTLAPLADDQVDAVVGLTDDATAPSVFCSGALIAPDVVLTAQHCTFDGAIGDLRVVFGADLSAPRLTLFAIERREHDTLDLAVLKLEARPDATIDVRPIPVATALLAPDQIGSLVEAGGYGLTHDGSEGRSFVTQRYLGPTPAADAHLEINGEGGRGVCSGDSGGPALAVTADGAVRVIGALSFGLDPCGTFDFYVRTDVALDFIEDLAGPTPAAVPEACGADVTEAGACSAEGTVAVFCDAGSVARVACPVGTLCAEGDDGARRCRPVEALGACGDVTAFGRCDDDGLAWCDDGVVRQRDCAACGERCARIDDALGYACVPADPCDFDAQGSCTGDVLRACEDGAAVVRDCASEGTVCAYAGPSVGHACVDPAACDGVDYGGACDGDVLRWCDDGELFEDDCGAAGYTCVTISEAAGSYCL